MFHHAGGGDMDDMMSMMFASGMMGGMPRRRRGKTIGLPLSVTLEDLYKGGVFTVPREKTVVVGNRMVTKSAPLKVSVVKGMEHEHQIPFRGEGDQHPELDEPGDVVVVLQLEKHSVFTRDGNDLCMTKKISLAEALCGFQFTITHLDGRVLLISSQTGEIVKPGDRKSVVGEGMPIFNPRGPAGPARKGDLIIEFEVAFPERIEAEPIDVLRRTLPTPSIESERAAGDSEECYMHPRPLDEVRKEMKDQADDDDDVPQGGGGGVRCAQQ